MTTKEEFLQALYPESTIGYVSLLIKGKGKLRSHFLPCDQRTAIASCVDAFAQNEDVYFSVCPQREALASNRRGDVGGVHMITSLWADIDVGKPGCPSSIREGLDFLGGLPIPPSIVVGSGGGLHAYWLLTSPIVIETDEDRQRASALTLGWHTFINRQADAKGWKFDNVSDLARVLRLPGTLNHKTLPPRPVEVLLFEPLQRHSPESLASFAPDRSATGDKTMTPTKRDARGKGQDERFAPADLDAIADKCAWMAFCRDNAAELPEPHWYFSLSIIGRCTEREQRAHEWSKAHPKYDKEETENKLQQALERSGPVTCDHVASKLGFSGCDICPHRGQVKSPIALGHPFTGKFVYVVETKKFYERSNLVAYDKEQFNDEHRTVVKGASDLLLSCTSLTRVYGLIYAPNQPPITNANNTQHLNTWKAPALTPREGDVTPFLEHLAYIVPDEQARTHLLNFLAHLYQRPGEKIAHVFVLQGGQGIGKSWLGSLLRHLRGTHNVRSVSPEMLNSSFQGWIKDVEVVILEELMAGGRHDVENKLRELITETRIHMNEKYRPTYDMQNVANFIAFTNHEDALPIPEDDRRYYVYFSPAQQREATYYNWLWAWLETNADAVAHFLANWDLSDWNPKARPSMTEGKRQMIASGLPALEQHLQHAIQEGRYPFTSDLVTIDAIIRSLPPNYGGLSPHRLGKALKTIKVMKVRQVRAGGTRPNVWAIHRVDFWKNQTEESIARELQRTGIVSAGGHIPDDSQGALPVARLP